MIHLVIQSSHSTLGLTFSIYYFCITFLYFSMYSRCWDLIKVHIYYSFFKSILSEKFRNSLWGSDVLLFPEIINKVSYYIVTLLNELHCYTSFSNFFCLIQRMKWFYRFHLVSLQKYYLFFPVQVPLIIFEELIFWLL